MSLTRRSRNQPSSLTPPWNTPRARDSRDVIVSTPRALPPVNLREGEVVEELVPVDTTTIPGRIHYLEERLQAQERTSQALIDRAYRIKEEVISSLNFTKGTRAEEKHALDLLQQHIHSITSIVQRLNADIATIEQSIKSRDQAHVSTNKAVKEIEVNHVATLTDLKGRVVRCDSAISKLGTEVQSCMESVKELSRQHQDMNSRVMERVTGLEQQLLNINNQMERQSGENRMKLSHMQGDTSTQMSRMDGKTRQMVDEVKKMMTALQTSLTSERERSEQRLKEIMDKEDASKTLIIEKLDKRMEDMYHTLDTRVNKLERTATQSSKYLAEVETDLESKIHGKMDGRIQQNASGLRDLKRECHKALATVHENITSVKTVLEGKHKIVEDQLHKELAQIRKVIM